MPVLVFPISVLKHPGCAFSFLLQDDGYALGRFGYVRDFVKVTDASVFSINTNL
jgi:hypothetical protein